MTTKDFIEGLPAKMKGKDLGDINTILHFEIQGDEPASYTVKIVDGKPEILTGLIGVPECKITSKGDALNKIVNKEMNPMMAMMTGKLKISNPSVMMKYASALGLM